MKVILVLLITLAWCSTSAVASVSSDLAAIEAGNKACVEKNSDNASMKECTNKAYIEADKVLNNIYKSAKAQLMTNKGENSDVDDKNENLNRLLASEKIWINYKDAECKLQGIPMLGGSGESLLIYECLYSLTDQRAKALDDLFGNEPY